MDAHRPVLLQRQCSARAVAEAWDEAGSVTSSDVPRDHGKAQ